MIEKIDLDARGAVCIDGENGIYQDKAYVANPNLAIFDIIEKLNEVIDDVNRGNESFPGEYWDGCDDVLMPILK